MALLWAPHLSDAYANLAAVHRATSGSRRDSRRLALRALRTAIELEPTSSALYMRMGAVLSNGQPLSSLSAATQRRMLGLAKSAVQLRPDDGTLWGNLGLAWAALNNKTLAATAYRQALSILPTNIEA